MQPAAFPIPLISRTLIDTLIRFGLIALLAVFCFEIFRPFLNLIVWSVIMAITLYPLQRRLRGRVFAREGWTAALLTLLVIAVLLVPSYLLGAALIDSVERVVAVAKSGELRIPQPAASVADWPLIGRRLYDVWLMAATDTAGLAQRLAPHLRAGSVALLGAAGSLSMGLLVFLGALVISGIFIAYGELGARSAVRIASRLSGPQRGPRIAALCTSTIRAVALGVIGIAFIQMLLVGIGFVIKGVPGAGLLALGVLLLGIMQLPATLIVVPVIAFLFFTEGMTAANIGFSIYVLVAGLADNVLKPLLLGRGVDVPMPVVLIGALGGMVTGGIIGLFIGPVALGVAYQLFWQWVDDMPDGSAAPVPIDTRADVAGVGAPDVVDG